MIKRILKFLKQEIIWAVDITAITMFTVIIEKIANYIMASKYGAAFLFVLVIAKTIISCKRMNE